MGRKGATYIEIGKKYGVSRQRIKQIISKYIPDWKDNYGGVVRRNAAAEKWYDKWGDKTHSRLYQMQRLKFSRKKSNAIRTGYTWDITFGQIKWPTHCPILGLELDYFAETRMEHSPSFDRIDSTKGYVKDNVIILSWRANRIKNDGSAKEHRAIAEYLDSLHS